MPSYQSINQSIIHFLSSISQSKDSVRDALAARTSKTMPPTQLSQIKLAKEGETHACHYAKNQVRKNKLTKKKKKERDVKVKKKRHIKYSNHY